MGTLSGLNELALALLPVLLTGMTLFTALENRRQMARLALRTA